MGFLAAFTHDIFISYAHVNDVPWDGNAGDGGEPPRGWVTRFVDQVRQRLSEKVGRAESIDLYFDNNQLRSNHKIDDTIRDHLTASATFVALQSPPYVASIWCRDEARLFAQHFKEELSNRVFVVELEPLDDDVEQPPELTGRKNAQFWIKAGSRNRPLAWPMSSQQELLYRERLLDLTDDIYAQLKAMSGRLPRADMRPLTGEPTRPGQSHALVFLDAEPSYQPLASQIREAFGDRVAWFDPLSEGTAEEIRQDLEQNLIECDALILIYGDNLSWARTQFRLLRKLEHLRDRPLRTISVIDVPAPAKQPLGVHGFPTVLIDTRDGITQTVIGQLAKCLEL